ncbi:MAG TPA: hypothetical protein VGG08_01310 [Solirubrobacteraceae bacterium]
MESKATFHPRRIRTGALTALVALLVLCGAASAQPLSSLRMVNYFPSQDGWGSMWWNWNPAQMALDFKRIGALHANAVRIIVSASAFGFPHPSQTMESRLERTLTLAAAAHLRVQLTLFNEWREYEDVADSRTWAAEVLAPLRGSPRIAYVDLHNELPSSAPALAWARAMVPFVQSIDGGIPVTVSTSVSSGVAPLRALSTALAGDPPNLYDVHYYGKAADAYAVLAQARALAGGLPLVVGETGFATDPSYGWAGGLEPATSSLDSYQDYYFRTVELATRVLGLPPAAPWILYDMPGQGGTRWGFHMGILHTDGAPKPAATAIADAFAGTPLSSSFNNGFEQSAGHPALPALWRRWLGRDARFAVDRTVAHSGRASARISDARGNHLTGCPAFYAAPIATIQTGATYTASVWARGRSTLGESRVVLAWTDAGGHYISSSNSRSLPHGDSPWTRLSVSAQPPPGASAVEIDLQVCESPGTTWFDDVGFSPTAGTIAARRTRRG